MRKALQFTKPHGKSRPWLLRATPLLAVTAIALWTVPALFDGIATIAVLFSCKILYEAAYTMFNIPMGSLLSAMSRNDSERASLSSARGVGSMIGMFGDRTSTAYMITGKHTEGSIYGTFNLACRIGQAVGSSLGFYVLGWIGFDAALEVQSAGTIFGLKALCVLRRMRLPTPLLLQRRRKPEEDLLL